MKRVVLLILAGLFLLSLAALSEEKPARALETGDSVFLGRYEQDNNSENGSEPIEWMLLNVADGQALLLSRYALDCRAYNDEAANSSWAECSLRRWLNDSFLQAAFTEEERLVILETAVKNDETTQNPEWKRHAAEDTVDRVFLPSWQEVMNAFLEKDARKTTGTEYARAQGAKFLGITTIGYDETDWWLRSPGEEPDEAAYIGVVRDVYSKDVEDAIGIRPAIRVDLTADRSLFPYERHTLATQCEADGAYAQAAEVYEALGSFYGSEECARRCRYQQACAALEAGTPDEALSLFEALGNYEDSFRLGRAARYAIAVNRQEVGEYEAAAQLFEKAGQYEDSMARLKECYQKLGVSVYYFGAEAVNAGTDTGYSKAGTIKGGDKHFGWRLGRFFVSGFTRVAAEETELPVFVKTLGDSVTLWFDLEQNIDALNGNTDLSVCADTDGYDQYFGVPKTNFGRGTLIVRHTDYQNRKNDPQIYTDYVLAKGTSGADTKIVLREEGDYEIALDYEVYDGNLLHLTNKYGNYRIFLRFSVRNGNCMVFPFDVQTGAELQNTSVTENGFFLDLARSRYLDIDVKYSVLTKGATGTIEDVRFNRPAKDGDRYTSEGIYTISVRNRYTGESTVKTIFVGTEAQLQEAIENGFSADRLK